MKRKSSYEPEAKVMRAEDVWDDAQQLAQVLRQNLWKAEPLVRVQIPLSALLSALDSLSQDELRILQKRVEQKLAT